jgi:uncharacterized membrane protein
MTGLRKARSPLVAVVIIVATSALFHVAIVQTSRLPLTFSFGGLFKLSFIGASALAHWSIYASLLTTFALTLRPGRTPLITSMAHRLHGALSDEMIRYTRGVTIAWSLFFAAQLLTSILLFSFAPLTVWSVFVNLLDVPLVATMFAAEYAYRLYALRDPPRQSFAMILKMISECAERPSAGRGNPPELPHR